VDVKCRWKRGSARGNGSRLIRSADRVYSTGGLLKPAWQRRSLNAWPEVHVAGADAAIVPVQFDCQHDARGSERHEVEGVLVKPPLHRTGRYSQSDQ
jgi:hypothetical protein